MYPGGANVDIKVEEGERRVESEMQQKRETGKIQSPGRTGLPVMALKWRRETSKNLRETPSRHPTKKWDFIPTTAWRSMLPTT